MNLKNSINAREGDFIETIDNLIFDVKGLVHPPDRVFAYVRYIEDPNGDRERNGKKYKKIYSLNERDSFLRKNYPQYLYFDPYLNRIIESVPLINISKHYKPIERLKEMYKKFPVLDKIEKEAMEMVLLLIEEANISLNNIGISGSILVNLYNNFSDIDLIIYGKENCLKIYKTLNEIIGKNIFIKRYSIEDLKKLYDFRVKDTNISFEDFLKVEKRKVFQGKFKNRDYFIRFIKEFEENNEKYGDKTFIPMGYTCIKAKVIDDSDSIFTPCCYIIDEVKYMDNLNYKPLKQIISYRGRFCEQARIGEKIIAQGRIEKVSLKNEEYYQLVIGENIKDFMIIEA
jgi:predicted nucleotidyltransferase